MDFEQNENMSQPIEPGPVQPITGPSSKGTGWKIFYGIILALSILANLALFMILIGVVTLFATAQQRDIDEEVVRDGPRANKIVIISLEGIIQSEQAEDVYKQIKIAREDKHVKGVILRVNSPGGTISGSDQIYNEIQKYREEEGKPVVAFMQGVAASGGYYTSVACDQIIAEPTTYTGSIGVRMGYFVLEELLKGKLGVLPVILTAGEKKDWPSSFKEPTEEQLQYLRDRMLIPAYERFVEVVTEGRKESLTPDEVNELADGSILVAERAKAEKLIDEIGYLDDAIELVKSLAEIEKARVVEYRKAFSLAHFLTAESKGLFKFDRQTLYELTTPQVLYLWNED
jgi:protease-4